MLVDIELGHEDGFDVARRLAQPTRRTIPRVVLRGWMPALALGGS
jgi:CheY-like chemotaxis protein